MSTRLNGNRAPAANLRSWNGNSRTQDYRCKAEILDGSGEPVLELSIVVGIKISQRGLGRVSRINVREMGMKKRT